MRLQNPITRFERIHPFEKVRKHSDYLAILLVAPIPFLGLSVSGIWNIHDQNFPLNPAQRFPLDSYVWSDSAGHAGVLDLVSFARIWMEGIWAASYTMGMSAGLAQLLFIIGSTVLAGAGFIYFLKGLPLHTSQSPASRLIGSLFYLFNPYIMYRAFLGAYPWFDLVTLPFVLALVTRGFNSVETGKRGVGYAIAIALASIPTLTYHYETMLVVVAFVVAYMGWMLASKVICRRAPLWRLVKFSGLTGFLVVLSNAWWLLPLGYLYLRGPSISSAFAVSVVLSKPVWMSQYPLLMLQTLRLSPFLADPKYLDVWTPWYSWVVSPYMTAVALVLFGVCGAAIFVRPRNQYVLFFGLVLVVSVGLANGLSGPFGVPFRIAFDRFGLFRAAFSEIFKALHVATFSFAVLLSVSCAEIAMRFKISSWPGKVTARKVTAVGVPILLIALVIANSYPFTLNLFGSVERSAQVPSYYYEAASWIGSQGTDFRIMTLPQEANGVAYYSWNPGYLMVPVERTLFQASVLDSLLTPFFADHDFGQYIYNTIITNRTTYAGRLLSSFGVKYIMVPNDRFYESSFPSHQMWNISSVTAILNEQKDLVVVQRFGELSFYENLDFARSLAYGTYNYYTLPANTSLEAYKLWSTSENSTSQLQAFLAQDSGVPLEVTRNAIDLSGYVSTVRHPLNLTQSIHGWISFHLSNLWLNSLDGLNGTSSIDGVGNSTGETPPAEVAYCYCGAYANWSQSDMLGFWMKGPRAFSFDVLVRDFQNRVDQWNFEYTKPDSWSFFQANLDSSTTGDQSIDLSRVNMISFQIPGFQSSFGITAISLAKFSVSSPQQLKAVSPPPDLRFVRVSPTEIRVTALSVNPFVLVLSESFDQDWSATVNGAVLTHFVTNFYANGWYVPMSGTMEISIRFTVQQYVEVGAAISSLGILGILLVSMLRLKCERARTHRIRRK